MMIVGGSQFVNGKFDRMKQDEDDVKAQTVKIIFVSKKILTTK